METTLSDAYYKQVPLEQRERLIAFRTLHPQEKVDLLGTTWSYLLGGQGPEIVLILPGGERIGDVAFPLMQQLEQRYRCLYPAFPPVPTIEALVDGLAALLDRLSMAQVILIGTSFGGDVGQCFVRKYPDRVSKLILINTGIPDEQLGRATKRGKPIVSLLPLSITRWLIRRSLVKILAVRPEEQKLFQALLYELIAHLARTDMISTFDETIDYRLNYHFSHADLATWPGKILILQSDDDPATKPTMRLALLQMYPQALVHTFEHAGHTPFLSQPDIFFSLLHTFLQKR